MCGNTTYLGHNVTKKEEKLRDACKYRREVETASCWHLSGEGLKESYP